MNTDNTVQKQHNPTHLTPYQFKDGVSGNPSGRPKGSRNLSTVFQEALDMLVTENNVSGDWKTVERLMIQKQIEKALGGF